jgi:hypothetical protein
LKCVSFVHSTEERLTCNSYDRFQSGPCQWFAYQAEQMLHKCCGTGTDCTNDSNGHNFPAALGIWDDYEIVIVGNDC